MKEFLNGNVEVVPKVTDERERERKKEFARKQRENRKNELTYGHWHKKLQSCCKLTNFSVELSRIAAKIWRRKLVTNIIFRL